MKKLLFIPLVLAYFLQWLFTVLQNICEALANGFEEISIFLTKHTAKDAKTEPSGNTATSKAD